MAAKTVTVKSSGGDYTSLNAALSGESADLVANTRLLTIECYNSTGTNGADTTSANTGTGYTVNSTYYIKITVPSANRHSGVFNTSAYHMKFTASGTWQRALYVQEQYTVIEYIQVELSTSYGDCSGIIIIADYCKILACVLKATVTGGSNLVLTGVDLSDYSNNTIANCLVYDFVSGTGACRGIVIGDTYDAYNNYCYNNTVINCRTGYLDSGTNSTRIKNCIAQLCNDGFSAFGSTGVSNNCSDIASDAPGTSARTGTVAFVDADNDNYHLSSGDTVALGYGVNLYNDANYPFQIDIDGQDRGGSGASWDIGADEYVAAAGGASIVPVLLYKYRPRRT